MSAPLTPFDHLQHWHFITPAQLSSFTGLSQSQAWRILQKWVKGGLAVSLGRIRLSPFLPAAQWYLSKSALAFHLKRRPGNPVSFPDGRSFPAHYLYVSETARWLTDYLNTTSPSRPYELLSESFLRGVYGWFGNKPPKTHPNPWATYVPDMLLVFPAQDTAVRVEVQLSPKADLWENIRTHQNDAHPTLLVCHTPERLAYYEERLPPNRHEVFPLRIGDTPQLEVALSHLRTLAISARR